MKAAVIPSHGGVECVIVDKIPEPKAGENEVVLEIHSAALTWIIHEEKMQ